VFAYFNLFPFPILDERAQRMLKYLKDLRHELRMAEMEATKASLKLVIHAGMATFEALNPELSLLSNVRLFVMDELSEIFLGPNEQSAAERARSLGIPGVKVLSAAVEHVMEFDDVAMARARATGKVATSATLYFDVKEIVEGVERMNQIQESLRDLRKAYDDLKNFLNRYSLKLRDFEIVLARAETRIGDSRDNVNNTRDALNDDMKRFGYNPNTAMAWRAQ
jgi:hypothetical protein